jgi:hypothetical protein
MANKTNENIVTVIQAVLWIGAVSFLIWYSVIELQKVKETDYLPPSVTDVDQIDFPSMMICPSVEALSRTPSQQPINSVYMPSPSLVNPGLPWDTVDEKSYLICPARVSFTSPDNTTAVCIEFSKTKFTESNTLADNGCDPNAATPQYQKVTDPVTPWTTKNEDTVIELVNIMNDANIYFPMVALLYSDDGNSIWKRPTTFYDYRTQFSVSVADRILVPLMATTNLYVKKYIRDKFPADSTCNVADFETQQDNWGYVTPDPSPVITNCTGQNSSCIPYLINPTSSTVFMTYDSLTITTTCHLTKHPLVFGDVLGIVGGGIAIVLTITLFLSKIISWCVTRGGESSQNVNDTYKGLI